MAPASVRLDRALAVIRHLSTAVRRGDRRRTNPAIPHRSMVRQRPIGKTRLCLFTTHPSPAIGAPPRREAPCPVRRKSGRIAQLVEQLTLNQRVLGSSPSASTNPFSIWWFLERAGPTPRAERICNLLDRFLPAECTNFFEAAGYRRSSRKCSRGYSDCSNSTYRRDYFTSSRSMKLSRPSIPRSGRPFRATRCRIRCSV